MVSVLSRTSSLDGVYGGKNRVSSCACACALGSQCARADLEGASLASCAVKAFFHSLYSCR